MPDHIANRDTVLRGLREELVGPAPRGQEIDCSGEVQFEEAEAGYRPHRQLGSGEEILHATRPPSVTASACFTRWQPNPVQRKSTPRPRRSIRGKPMGHPLTVQFPLLATAVRRCRANHRSR